MEPSCTILRRKGHTHNGEQVFSHESRDKWGIVNSTALVYAKHTVNGKAEHEKEKGSANLSQSNE